LTDLPPFDDADLFDEAGYLRLYPGVAEAMMQGLVDTAWSHYFHHGRHEGRQANDVDPNFYLAAYPAIARDLGQTPVAADAAPHFLTLGRARGYLPNAAAPRLANGAAPASPFGGFWTDQANALDLIEARIELGRIKRRDGTRLRTFALEGVVELTRRFDRAQFDAASLAVDHAFAGQFPAMVFAPPALFAPPASIAESELWRPELTERNIAALDPHMLSGDVRALLLDKAVTDFLTVLFEAPPRLTASRAFLREGAPPDRDVAWFGHSLPLQFVAVTFELQDCEDGPALVWPGSHRLPDLVWGQEHVTLAEARRAGASGLEQALAQREQRVRALVHGQEPREIGSAVGRRMVRHANLIHAVTAPEPPRQRRSLTAWYCPSYVSPCYMETTPSLIHEQDGCAFSSGVYPDLDP
jgi:hypothetical protein